MLHACSSLPRNSARRDNVPESMLEPRAMRPPIVARSRPAYSLMTQVECLRSSMIWVRASAEVGMTWAAVRSCCDDMIRAVAVGTHFPATPASRSSPPSASWVSTSRRNAMTASRSARTLARSAVRPLKSACASIASSALASALSAFRRNSAICDLCCSSIAEAPASAALVTPRSAARLPALSRNRSPMSLLERIACAAVICVQAALRLSAARLKRPTTNSDRMTSRLVLTLMEKRPDGAGRSVGADLAAASGLCACMAGIPKILELVQNEAKRCAAYSA